MNVLRRLTIRNLRLNKKRTLVTVIGIMLSVAMLSAVASMFFSARTSIIRYQKQQGGDYHCVFRNVPAEDMQVFRFNRKVERACVLREVGYAILEGGTNEYKPYLHIEELDSNAMEHMGIRMVSGRMPKREGEILISSHIATNGGVSFHVGDTLTLEVGRRESDGERLTAQTRYQPEETVTHTKTRQYRIVGIMERPDWQIEGYEAPGYSCYTLPADEFNSGSADVYVRYTKQGLKDYEQVSAGILGLTREELQSGAVGKYNYDTNSYLIQLESGILEDGSMRALALAGAFVVLIIIFTSAFCIKNSFDISIAEKIRQYGMLRSVGGTAKQIRKNVYDEAALVGLAGIPAGIICGNLASYVLLQVINRLLTESLNVTLYYELSWPAVLFSVVLGYLTVYLSARRGAVRAAKVTPIQAITDSAQIRLRRDRMHTPKWIEKIFGVGGMISYKNLKRSKKKYRTTVISITVCVATFIATASFVDLAFDTIRWEMKSEDYMLCVQWSSDTDGEERVEKIRALDGIDDCTWIAYDERKLENASYSKDYLKLYPEAGTLTEDWEDSLSLCIVDEQTYRNYVKELHLSYDRVKDQGILLNQIHEYVQMNQENELKEVQIPMFTYRAGDTVGGIKIAGLTEKTFVGLDAYQSSARLIVNRAFYDKGPDYVYETVYINCEDPDRVQTQIEEICKDDETLNVENRQESARQTEAFYTLLAIFFYGFIAVIALIGITSIFNTITTNMQLRRQEFAMLKSIGMTTREFNRMIRLESIFCGGPSLAIGIPVGCVLSYLIYRMMSGGSTDVGYRLPLWPVCVSVIAVFALLLAIMRYSMQRIRKQNLIETIRNENI